MANNEIKTNAEIYREQRKARLAKAAKKKKSSKADKVIRVIVKALCILLAVGIVLFGIGSMLSNIFGVPQRILTAATYGEEKITAAEYNYYYMNLYNEAASMSQQYDQQSAGAGSAYFNLYTSPAEQDYTGDDAPETVKTWQDYFRYTAPQRAFLMKKLYNEAMSEEAKANGFEITEAQKTEIETEIQEYIDTHAEKAKEADYALDNYIARVYGSGVNEKVLRELSERDSIARLYLQWYQKQAQSSITKETVDKYYADHKDEIDVASFRYFTVSYAEAVEGSTDPVYTKEQAKARAEQFKSEAATVDAFVAAAKKFAPASYKDAYASDSATLAENLTKTNLTQLSEDFANWTFDAKRVAGDIAIFDVELQEAYYIILMTEPAHKDTSVASADVRHLLVQAQTTREDAEGASIKLSEDEIAANFAAAKTEADKLLQQWKNEGATEEKFIELVKAHTDDAGSAETGGLYEGITSTSSYVPEFLEWSLGDHKKGDTGIIKTDYGYHIMYMVSSDPTEKWESDIRTTLSSDDYNAYVEDSFEDIKENTSANELIVKWTSKSVEKIINSTASQYSQNALAQYSY